MPATRSAPVIGICAAMECARWSVWDLPAALVPMNYIEQVQRAGGVAVLIPPDPSLVDDPGRVLDRIDGLMLVGGPDVDAARYGAAPHPAAEPPVPLRDAVEIALIRGASERGLPVLGICRGMQVINVARGGTMGASPATSTRSRSPRARARRGRPGGTGRSPPTTIRPWETWARACG